MVTIDEPAIGARIRAASQGLSPWDTLLGTTALEFRKFFNDALKVLKLEAFNLRPYSLRRGGATHHLCTFNDLQLALFRGRWSSVKVGRIYLTDGLAAWTKLKSFTSPNSKND